MNSEIVNKVLGYMDSIGKVVTDGAKMGYEILVRQQIAIGIVETAGSLLAMVIIPLIIRFLLKKMQEDPDSDWDIGLSVTSIFGGIGLIVLIFLLGNGVLHLINPQYYAIEQILGSFK